MKRWIVVFIAFLGSIYTFFSTTISYNNIRSAPQYTMKKTNSNIEKKVITYKNINIHTPVIKDFNKLEIIGVDRKSMPVVYYKYDNDIKTAQINDTIEKNYKIEHISHKSVIIKNLSNMEKEEFDI